MLGRNLRCLLVLAALVLGALAASPFAAQGCGPGPDCYFLDAPRNLTVSVQPEGLLLEWEPPEDTNGYRLYYAVMKGNGSGEYEYLEYWQEELGYLDTSVSPGTEYFYSVYVTNFYGSPTTGPVRAVFVTYPSEPRNLTADCSKGRIDLRWEPPEYWGGDTNITYDIYMAEETGELTKAASDVDATHYDFSGLVNQLTYRFRVEAVNLAGAGNATPDFESTPMHLPSVPRNLGFTSGCGYVHLTWDPPADSGGEPVLTYEVYKAMLNQPPQLVKGNVTGNDYNVTGLNNGIAYFFSVKAVNYLGASEATEQLLVHPIGEPGAPLDVSAEYGDHQVGLRWSPPLDDGGAVLLNYTVYVSTDGERFRRAATGIEELNFTVEPLENGREHLFIVAAVNSKGEGARSAIVRMTPVGLASSPVRLEAAAGPMIVELSWDRPVNDGGCRDLKYRVLMCRPGVREPVNEFIVNGTGFLTIACPDTGEYCYQVSAITPAGEGPAVWVLARADPSAPAAPQDPGQPPVQDTGAAPPTSAAPPVEERPPETNVVPAVLASAPVAVLAVALMLLLVDRERRRSKKRPLSHENT